MVVDATNFVDDTWLSQNGTIHSDAMHVIEKLTREGNVITWEISIERFENVYASLGDQSSPGART